MDKSQSNKHIPNLSMCVNYILKQGCIQNTISINDAALLCHNTGFNYVDYTSDFQIDNWIDNAYKEREILDLYGINVEQTHSPINRYRQFPDDIFWEYFKRSFEISKILGAKYVVVHADEYRTVDRYNEKEVLEYTYNYLAPYVEYSIKNGMTVAIENVFEDNNYRWPAIDGKSRYTSRIEELKAIIERFNDKNVGCCWDFGHASVAFGLDGMTEALKEVGKYVVCTHIHDNYGRSDLHLLPFLGDINWVRELNCLADFNYEGNLSFELNYGSVPKSILQKWLDYAHSVGEYLIELFEGKKL